MTDQELPAVELKPTRPIRIGVVSFVNTLPLIDGLDNLADLELHYTVPSLLLDKLINDEVDVALCSSIDYQRAEEPLVILPAGLLGCQGSTLTVRLYSSVRIDRISEVHCDSDSHTSIALMRILLKELHGIEPQVIDYDARERVAENRPIDWPAAMLLIGDKVVTDSPPAIRYPHQLDLGAAWAALTGLPFVFALWMAKRSADRSMIGVAAAILDHQRRHNQHRLDLIVRRRATPRRWPADLASGYLKGMLTFELTEPRREGLELFFDKARAHGLIEQRRPLEILAE
ncbi:MAG: menaquinone biosynthetic enzyme MqnA/MqnD family protein [Planctomycetota bacterium]|jgi:chorismate dehydratase